MKKWMAVTASISFGIIGGVMLFWLVIAAKNASYIFFYEDMVVETIKETVKPEFLIED